MAVLVASGTYLPRGLTFGPTNGPEDLRGAVSSQDVSIALLQHVLSPEDGAEDAGQMLSLWHAIFAAPLCD